MSRGSRAEPLVGRTRELEIARELLDTASGGVPQLLVLSGEAGIGKSRLARAITADASSRGAHTLWGAGQEDLPLPYLPLTMALGPLNEHGVWLLGSGAASAHPAIEPTRAWGEVAEVLLAATRSPVVLVVDDLQWIDAASQALLLHLLVLLDHAATTRPVRLLTIITVRTPIADGRAGRTLSRLEREPNAVTLELGGLDRAELRDLLTRVGPAPPSAALVQRVMESTSGSPLLAQSILRRGVHEGRLTVVAGALTPESADPLIVSPNELDRAVVDGLAQVSRPCTDLLTVAAFLGDHHPIDEVADLAGIPTATAEGLVDEAIEAGLLRDVGARCAFSTSQVRHVLFHAPHRRARQRLHLHLADGLEARGDRADCLAIAHHLSRAGDLVDRERLARWTGLAARQAMSIGAWADAGIAAEQALAAAPADSPWEDLADLRILLTEAASHDFDLAAASRHGTAAVELAREHGDTTRWGRALLPLARTLVTNASDVGLGPSSTQLIQDYLASCSDAEPTIRAQLLSLLSEIWSATNRPDDAMAAAIAARDLLDGDTDARVTAAVRVAEGMARWARLDLPEAKQAYEGAIRASLDDPASPPGIYASVRRTLVDHLAGDVEGAAATSATLLTRLASTQMWGEHALAAAGAASTAVPQGRFDEVERLTAAAELSVSRSSYLWPRAIALPAVALARALRGDGTGARDAIGLMTSGTGTAVRYGLAIDALLGDTERVAEAVRARPWRAPGPDATMQTLPGLVLHAEVAAAVGDEEMATAALDPLIATHDRGVLLSQGWAVLLSRLIADCLLVAGAHDQAGTWLDLASREARARGLVGEAARVALSEARLASLDSSASDLVRQERATVAARSLDALGALPLAASARRLGRVDDRTDGPARRAILFTDLVDSTGLNIRAGDATFLELMREHNEVVRTCLRRHAGVEFKHTGDGIAAWFAAPADAVDCAVAIGHGLERATVLHPDLPLRVRTGISVGEPLGNEGDLFGLSVVRASRLCALAEEGEVLVSDEVASSVRSRHMAFQPRGPQRLKGFPHPVEVHSLVPGAADIGTR